MSAWNKADDGELGGELTVSNLRMMTEDQQQGILFKAIRACDLHAIRSILQVNRTLLTAKMFGYEGTDVFEIVKNSKTKRCYTYTGPEKANRENGYFYPLHVAAESGHKNLTILLVKAGADIHITDYRGRTAEEVCNGNAQHAFYELRGLKFEARERYQGKTDRQGRRHGQGLVFFKPEGYMMEERQLYRGSFKNGLYHGHGSLYHPGTEVIAYIGRFKEGLKHGRGIEFDVAGQKIYQGTFRDDKREGRGEEFQDKVRTYRGEFSNNMRHGFGIAFYSESSKYYGRYENNLMSGVGIYVHPDGNRFEGMFFNNKADGPGSFYERDTFTGNFSGTHALWQAGKKLKETNTPFIPTLADLPDDTTKNLFTEIMNNHHAVISGYADDDGDGMQDENGESKPSLLYNGSYGSEDGEEGGDDDGEGRGKKKNKAKKAKLDFSYFDDEAHMQALHKTDWWKVQLGKYIKIPLEEAPLIGLSVPPNVLSQAKQKHDGDKDTKDKEKDEEEDESSSDDDNDDDDVDEVIGYHFMSCTPLFSAYVYITSASKVFEDRLVNKGLQAEFPDFEAVYHLVIDAVDNYNEEWELAYKLQTQQQQLLTMSGGTNTAVSPMNPMGLASASTADIESRRMMFMTEKEKKAEQIIKQRAELAVKKGTAELDPQMEKTISKDVLAILEQELTKLLAEESEEKVVHNNLPIARKGMVEENVPNGQKPANNAPTQPPQQPPPQPSQPTPQLPPPPLTPSNTLPTKRGSTTTPQNAIMKSPNNTPGNNVANKKSPVPGNSADKDAKAKVGKDGTPSRMDANVVNLEDLFDLDNFSTTAISTGYEDEAGSADHDEDHHVTGSNEFAAELLYIMKLAMSLT